jgi:hypothetical protein
MFSDLPVLVDNSILSARNFQQNSFLVDTHHSSAPFEVKCRYDTFIVENLPKQNTCDL